MCVGHSKLCSFPVKPICLDAWTAKSLADGPLSPSLRFRSETSHLSQCSAVSKGEEPD